LSAALGGRRSIYRQEDTLTDRGREEMSPRPGRPGWRRWPEVHRCRQAPPGRCAACPTAPRAQPGSAARTTTSSSFCPWGWSTAPGHARTRAGGL